LGRKGDAGFGGRGQKGGTGEIIEEKHQNGEEEKEINGKSLKKT